RDSAAIATWTSRIRLCARPILQRIPWFPSRRHRTPSVPSGQKGGGATESSVAPPPEIAAEAAIRDRDVGEAQCALQRARREDRRRGNRTIRRYHRVRSPTRLRTPQGIAPTRHR